ncbi:hypothetical protein SUGI_0992030 [Cryptomeria japonica]|nr:hypothetical protein SUGI_0992030 [Cryptomeria japonica]
MEGGFAKIARLESGPGQDQKGEVPVRIPTVTAQGSIPIRAPVSDDIEDDDNDKEGFDTEEGGEEEGEECFESAPASPVGSFTNNNHPSDFADKEGESLAKVRKASRSHSDSDDSYSSSPSSSSSSSFSGSRRPRVRPVAKVSGEEEEEQPAVEVLVHESEEEEGFRVAKVPPLVASGGVVSGFGEQSLGVIGGSEGSAEAFEMGNESSEIGEVGVSERPAELQQGLASVELEGAEGVKDGVLDAAEDSMSKQDGEGKEPSEIEGGKAHEIGNGSVLDKNGDGLEDNGSAESGDVGLDKASDETVLVEKNDSQNGVAVDMEPVVAEEEKSRADGIDAAEEDTNVSQVEKDIVGPDAGESTGPSEDVQGPRAEIHQAADEECAPEDVIVKERGDKGNDLEEFAVKSTLETEEKSLGSPAEEVTIVQDVGESFGQCKSDELQESIIEINQEAGEETVLEGADDKKGDDRSVDVQEFALELTPENGVAEVQAAAEKDVSESERVMEINQTAGEESVPEDADLKESGDKSVRVQELALEPTPENGVAELQAAAEEDASESESNRDKMVEENVSADAVKVIDGSLFLSEKYDAQDSQATEVASASPLPGEQNIDTEGVVDKEVEHYAENALELVDSELKHADATVEVVDDAQEIKAGGVEDSKDGVETSQREEQGFTESKGLVKSKAPTEIAVTIEGGQADTSTPESFPPSITETLDATSKSKIESSTGDYSIQKVTDDEDMKIIGSSSLGASTDVVGSAINVSSLSSNFDDKVSNQQSNVNEDDGQNMANEVVSPSSVTSQQTTNKEDIVETGSVVSHNSSMISKSNMPDNAQETEVAALHQDKSVENQTVKVFNFTDGTPREEAEAGLESQKTESVEVPKEAILGSLDSNEHICSSKPGASSDDSNNLMKSYFSAINQVNKGNVLDDEESAASYANPHITFESSSGDESVQKVVGQMVTDWDDEEDDDEDEDEEEMVDPSALAALMEVANSAVSGSNTASFGDAGFPVSTRPAGLGASVPSLDPMPRYIHHSRPNGAAISRPSPSVEDNQQIGDSSDGYDETQEKLQMIRVKFLRVVQRLGQTPQNVVVTQVLYRLGLAEGLKRGASANRAFSSDRASAIAEELEAAGQEDLDFTCNILVLGKTGVGKSATINSIFDESKSATNAFQPATCKVREILGTIHGIKVRVVDTPGLMPSSADQRRNKNIILSIKKFIKKSSPDIVLYFDRLDVQSRDYSDLPLLKLVTETFGAAIWFNTIVVLTHAASAPPDGANGSPLSYEMFVAQRSHIVQHSIRQAAGDMRLMNPVSLVENHSACRRNREGQRVLPNGQVWKPQLLLLCLSSKVLAEANALLKLQDNTPGKPLGLRTRAPPLPFLLSSLLQSRAQLKAPDEDGEDIDSDIDLEDLSDTEVEDEYDRLPPFKYLTKSELSELTKEEREAYYDEKYNREKLYQKKQWKEELKRRKNMKKKSDSAKPDSDKPKQNPEEEDDGQPEPEAVPMPDMTMPQTFDSDNPTYRYRYLDTPSQWLVRPVLDTNGWDHDTGYDGVNVERMFVIKNKIPASVSGQLTKDKKEANFQMECAASVKHGEHQATLASFDVQSVGRGLAYTLRSETKFSNFKGNKTAGGLSFTYLGNTLATGMKLEDSLKVGKRLKFVVNGGAMMGRGDVAYGGSLEATLRDKDYPVGQMLTTLGLSVMNWHGDLAIGGNLQSQFAVGRKWKVVTRANLNNRRSGQISIRTSSSEQLQIALIGLIPIIRSLIRGRLSEPPYST